jgi:hypothetical protein
MEAISLASLGEPLRQSKAVTSRKPSLNTVRITTGFWSATASHNVTCNCGLLGTVLPAVNEEGPRLRVRLTQSFSDTLRVRIMFRKRSSVQVCETEIKQASFSCYQQVMLKQSHSRQPNQI